MEIAAVAAELSGRFDHSSELNVMNFKEAMNRQDSNKWIKEVNNEHKRMAMNSVWEPFDKKDLPEGTKVITSK